MLSGVKFIPRDQVDIVKFMTFSLFHFVFLLEIILI